VPPGSRVAVNVTGVAHGDVGRGDALVEAGRWRPTRTFDASLRVLASLDHDVTRRGAYAAYLGAGEYPVAVRLLGDVSSVAPGDEAFVRLHLPVALPLLPGDRYVLREHGRSETVGGGEVLDVAPVLPAAKARPSRSVDRVVAERGWVDAGELERLTGEPATPTLGRWVVSPSALAETSERVRHAVADGGPLGLDVAGLDERERAVLATLDDVTVEAGRALPAGAAARDDPLADHPYVAALEAAPFTPPDPAGVDRAQLRELVRRGLVVERDGVYFAPSAVDAAARVVAGLLAGKPSGVTVAEIREALGSTRKYALPLLAVLDATGVTRRREDVRIGGPRLPPA
jgi:selenocysteine-specific elongation factor